MLEFCLIVTTLTLVYGFYVTIKDFISDKIDSSFMSEHEVKQSK